MKASHRRSVPGDGCFFIVKIDQGAGGHGHHLQAAWRRAIVQNRDVEVEDRVAVKRPLQDAVDGLPGVASGVAPADVVPVADVQADTIIWSAVSLTGQQLLQPQQYNADWWWAQKGGQDGFNWKLLPYLARSTVTHRAFWWGLAAGILLLSIVRRLLRRGV